MSRFDSRNRNLIIDCTNDLPSNVSDELAFISFYSFYNQFGDTLKPLVIIPSNKQSNIAFWASSFKVPVFKNKICLEEFIQKPAFFIKSGVVMLNQNFENNKSFDFFKSQGIKFFSQEDTFSNFKIIGELDDNFSSSFINLKYWIYKNNIINTLNSFYGNPSLLKIKGKPNEILFNQLLDKAHKIYINFPEIR
jgi:hypothetical protein